MEMSQFLLPIPPTPASSVSFFFFLSLIAQFLSRTGVVDIVVRTKRILEVADVAADATPAAERWSTRFVGHGKHDRLHAKIEL